MRPIALALALAAAGCASQPPPASRVVYGWCSYWETRLLAIERPTRGTAHLALYLQAPGGRFEGARREAAHVLEHLVLRTRGKRPPVSEAFDRAGGSIHGRTTAGWIAFHGQAPEDEIEELASILVVSIRGPALGSDDVEKERRLVAIETGRVPAVGGIEDLHREILAAASPLVVLVSERPVPMPSSAPDEPRIEGVSIPPGGVARWRDLAFLAADFGAAVLGGGAEALLEGWGAVRGSPGSWSWEAPGGSPPPLEPLPPRAVAVPERPGPRLVLRRAVQRDGPAERKELARALYHELVLDRAIGYGPWVRLEGRELVATVSTDPAHVEECRRALEEWGEVEIGQALAPEEPDW